MGGALESFLTAIVFRALYLFLANPKPSAKIINFTTLLKWSRWKIVIFTMPSLSDSAQISDFKIMSYGCIKINVNFHINMCSNYYIAT